MQELLLLSSTAISESSIHLVLSVLAGLAAAQPTPYTALHLVFAPTRAPASAAAATRSTLPNQNLAQQKIAGVAGDLFYVQLVGRMHESAERRKSDGQGEGKGSSEEAGAESETSATTVVDVKAHPWTLEFRDFPDAGKGRPVTSRLMASIPMTDGDPVAFVRAMGYEFHSAYIQYGHQVIHSAIQILLTKLLPVPTATYTSAAGYKAPSIPTTMPDPSALTPLDPSGALLLQASVRVADGAQPELLAQGGSELAALRTALKGVVELEPGDRMALDTRVKI